jgi:hypothetical protein
MSSWTRAQLHAIGDNDDLFVSPFCEDGTTYGTRPRHGLSSSAVTSTCEPPTAADDDVADAIDTGYEAKYSGNTAVPVMHPLPVTRLSPLIASAGGPGRSSPETEHLTCTRRPLAGPPRNRKM